jgi:nicotinamide-nucleotide amidase
MRELVVQAERIAALLKARKETVAVAESSAGGLITAALLAVPGASAYCLGGMVIYTRQAWEAMRDFEEKLLEGYRSSTPENALIRARLARDRFKATWGVGETGAAGPTGNRYGDPAGHVCIAVSGPTERSSVLKTGERDRFTNMHAFSAATLDLFEQALRAQ